MQRLGLFFTLSPRHADILLVTGGVTEPMREPLRGPGRRCRSRRRCRRRHGRLLGRVRRRLPRVAGGVDRVLPVDVYVPGSPPSPIALLHGLLLAAGVIAPERRPRERRLRAPACWPSPPRFALPRFDRPARLSPPRRPARSLLAAVGFGSAARWTHATIRLGILARLRPGGARLRPARRHLPHARRRDRRGGLPGAARASPDAPGGSLHALILLAVAA